MRDRNYRPSEGDELVGMIGAFFLLCLFSGAAASALYAFYRLIAYVVGA
jgi:hypothetical protein